VLYHILIFRHQTCCLKEVFWSFAIGIERKIRISDHATLRDSNILYSSEDDQNHTFFFVCRIWNQGQEETLNKMVYVH